MNTSCSSSSFESCRRISRCDVAFRDAACGHPFEPGAVATAVANVLREQRKSSPYDVSISNANTSCGWQRERRERTAKIWRFAGCGGACWSPLRAWGRGCNCGGHTGRATQIVSGRRVHRQREHVLRLATRARRAYRRYTNFII